MQASGYYLSVEAMLSLLLLSSLLALPSIPQNSSLERLQVLQKENDLMLVWAREGAFSLPSMEEDFRFVFPGSSGRIFLDGRETSIGKPGKGGTASSLVFFDRKMQRHAVRLVVFH